MSADLADSVQKSLHIQVHKSNTQAKNYGVKSALFYVLLTAQMPAILVETSFISNVSGEASLNIGDFRQKMADAIVNAIRAYREGL